MCFLGDLGRLVVANVRVERSPGLRFPSRQVETIQEIPVSTLPRVLSDLQQEVLAFDWWIRNEDRHFGAEGRKSSPRSPRNGWSIWGIMGEQRCS